MPENEKIISLLTAILGELQTFNAHIVRTKEETERERKTQIAELHQMLGPFASSLASLQNGRR